MLMNQVRAKLNDYTEWIDGLLDDTEASPSIEQNVKDDRSETLEKLKADAIKLVRDNEKLLKAKAATLMAAPPAPPAPGPGGPGGVLPPDKDQVLRISKVARLTVMEKQVAVKSKALQKVATAHADPDTMKENDMRIKIQESKDWLKSLDDIQKTVDTIEQDGAGLGSDVTATVKAFNDAKDSITAAIDKLKIIDKAKGFNSFVSGKARDATVFPLPYEGVFGTNVYKWCEDMTQALDGAQLREEDKVKKVLQFLKGDAKLKIGEFHRDVESVFKSRRSQALSKH